MIFAHCDGWTAAPPGASDGIFYTHNHFEQTNRTTRRATCRDFFLVNHRMNMPETDLAWKGKADKFKVSITSWIGPNCVPV